MTFRTPNRPGPFRRLLATSVLLALCGTLPIVVWLIGGSHALDAYADTHLGLALVVLAMIVGFTVDRRRARRRNR